MDLRSNLAFFVTVTNFNLRSSSHRTSSLTCRYRRDPNWSPPPPNQTVKPILTFTEDEFCEKPSLVSDTNAFARLIVLTDDNLSELLGYLTPTTDERLHMNLIDTTLQSNTSFPPSQPTSPSHCTYPLSPVKQTASFHETSNQAYIRQKYRHSNAPVCLSRRNMLLYTTSIWCPNMFHSLMVHPEDNQHLPTWFVLQKRDVYRSHSVLNVHYGTCPSVAESFGFPPFTPMWAREIVYRREKRPFLYVQEILSPTLEKYIGPMNPPLPACEKIRAELNFSSTTLTK